MSRAKDRPRSPDAEERLKREIERLRRELAERERQVAEQAKRIKDLEHQLALRSQNSTMTSKPPSSDGLAGKQRVRGRRQKSRRPRGGQPGHPGHWRPLVPADRVDAIVPLGPTRCRQCEHQLAAQQDVGEPRRHQVTELPQIAAHITEYRCHRRQCPACGQITQAAVPEDVAGQSGPQLTALVAYLTVGCRMPRLVVRRSVPSSKPRPPTNPSSTSTRRGIAPTAANAGCGCLSPGRLSSIGSPRLGAGRS